jgi:hypothetical protein
LENESQARLAEPQDLTAPLMSSKGGYAYVNNGHSFIIIHRGLTRLVQLLAFWRLQSSLRYALCHPVILWMLQSMPFRLYDYALRAPRSGA